MVTSYYVKFSKASKLRTIFMPPFHYDKLPQMSEVHCRHTAIMGQGSVLMTLHYKVFLLQRLVLLHFMHANIAIESGILTSRT